MNCPGAAARRSSIEGASVSINSVCSIITTASAPRGITPPVAIVVAVPGATSSAGASPQAITSALRRKIFGLASLALTVSAARSAKPSTLERSNGGASTAATTSCASTRVSAAESGTASAESGVRSRCRLKRIRASSAETTSRNCSWRAAARTRASSSALASGRGLRVSLMLRFSWPRLYRNRRAGGIAFAVGRHQQPTVRPRQRGQRKIFRGQRFGGGA